MTDRDGGRRHARRLSANESRVSSGERRRAALDSPEAVKEAALTLIERRLRTRADIEQRLRGRRFQIDIIEQVLDRLAEVGLVNDQAYAEAFLRDRRRFRPRSRRMLRTELRQRGVSDEVIEAAMTAMAEELDERDLAAELLARRAGRWSRDEPAARRRRAEALLRRNGFAWEVIREALAADSST